MTDMSPTQPPAPDARILERGYRRYEGARLGVRSSIRSVMVHAIQRALGLGRPAWTKVLPVLSIAIAYVPAIVFVGISALAPDDAYAQSQLPTYGEYYSFVVSAIALFVAFVAPEVLCPDRRTGMLGLYLASPLSRTTYLLGKAWAIANVLAMVSIGPPLVMMVAFTLQGHGPEGVAGFFGTFAKILASGVAITVFYGTLSMAVSSLTDRKSFASAGIIIALLLSGAISAVLDGGTNHNAQVLNLMLVPFDLANQIHGGTYNRAQLSFPTALMATCAWSLLASLVTWVRYERLEVTR